uniref:Disease resistance R13L4/SHOC-2-like LRR domain-containing protein n=1 Tax=Quercus lobata TaxID=97700 RepID=A0A7N2L2R8_QUELO
MVFNVEPVKMTISSEQKKIEIGEIGNLASQERQPERIQVEEMQPQALSTQGVVFDDGAVKILKSIGKMESQIEDVEMEPEATLFLPRNYKLRTIPPSFFDYMPALQILNLSRTGIKSLPDSLIRLVSLKILFLNDCHRLMTLSPKVGNLKLLEVLDLEGAKIMDLPMEIKELTNMKCLEVSFYGYMSNGRRAMQSNAVVPCGEISALCHLEELNVDVNPDNEQWDAHVEDIVTEWNSLSLSHFRFTVGRHVKRIMSRVPLDVEFELERWERSLKYINGVGVPGDIKKPRTTTEWLPPKPGFFKINIAGVLSSHRQCSVGICLQDSKEETLLAYCFKGRLARGIAEGQPMALIKGLELAKMESEGIETEAGEGRSENDQDSTSSQLSPAEIQESMDIGYNEGVTGLANDLIPLGVTSDTLFEIQIKNIVTDIARFNGDSGRVGLQAAYVRSIPPKPLHPPS